MPAYHRVPTVGTDPRFIAALAALVRAARVDRCRETPRGPASVSSILAAAYPWLKALHIIAVIAWMAGLLYLPRLYVYHADAPRRLEPRGDAGDHGAAAVARHHDAGGRDDLWRSALLLAATPGVVDWHRGWIWAKLALVALLTVFHLLLAHWRRDFAAGKFTHSARFYRVINELPTVVMIAIVLLVVVKPF